MVRRRLLASRRKETALRLVDESDEPSSGCAEM